MYIQIDRSCAGADFSYASGTRLEVGAEIPSDRAMMLLNGGLATPVRDIPTEKVAYPRHVGGGTYELPNGKRVKGKKAAVAAMGE